MVQSNYDDSYVERGAGVSQDRVQESLDYWETDFVPYVTAFLESVNVALRENEVSLKVEYLPDIPYLGEWWPEKGISANIQLHTIMRDHCDSDLPDEQRTGNLQVDKIRANPLLVAEIGGILGTQVQTDRSGDQRTSVIELKYYGTDRHEVTFNDAESYINTVTHIELPSAESVRWMNRLVIWHTHPFVGPLTETDLSSMLRTQLLLESQFGDSQRHLEEIYWAIYMPTIDKIQWYKLNKN